MKLKLWSLSYWAVVGILCSSCSIDNAQNHYNLAEKLWSDQKYAASLPEYDKVIAKDPRGRLGLSALYRSAMTQALFLSQYGQALEKLRLFIQLSKDEEALRTAKIQMGEILFEKLEQYDASITHYQNFLRDPGANEEHALSLFRIAKSRFFLLQFSTSEETYLELIKTYSQTSWAEKAYYELGVNAFTQGAKEADRPNFFYEKAISAFDDYIRHYPQGKKVSEAKFGIAACQEELNHLDEALTLYTELKHIYPSPEVIDIKVSRIKERIAQKKLGFTIR